LARDRALTGNLPATLREALGVTGCAWLFGVSAIAVTMSTLSVNAQEIPAPSAAVLVPGAAPASTDISSGTASIRRAIIAESATETADGKPISAPTLVLTPPRGADRSTSRNAAASAPGKALPPSTGVQKQLGLTPVESKPPLLKAAVGDNQLQPTAVPPPAPPGMVAPTDAAGLRAAYIEAFKALAADPGNLVKTFRFAELA
jgi:hypothetical protein